MTDKEIFLEENKKEETSLEPLQNIYYMLGQMDPKEAEAWKKAANQDEVFNKIWDVLENTEGFSKTKPVKRLTR